MGLCSNWRRWIRPLTIAFYGLIIIVALPLLIVAFQMQDVHIDTQAKLIGGLFVLMAVPISLWGIVQHCVHYTSPLLQRHIIRIIWMVPIYAGNAWFALCFSSAAIYLDTARECYEAYVIYNFMAYLLSYLWTEYPSLDEHLKEKPQVKHIVPFCFFPKWKNGKQIISYCKHGVLQYTVVRPVMTFVAFVSQTTGHYHEGQMKPSNVWIYVTFVNNCSQIWAMYCLVLFYKATKEELQPLKPVPKFLCIKAVVFFSFWQSVLISILQACGVIHTSPLFPDENELGANIQDFLICVEMFFAAIAHYYSFSHKPYVDYAQGYQNMYTSFRAMFDVRDVRDDVVQHVRTVGASATNVVTRPLRKTPAGTDTEKSSLLRHDSNTSTENADIEPLDVHAQYAYSATPPVVLTSRDFYDSIESRRSTASSAYGHLQRSSQTPLVLVVDGETDSGVAGDLTQATDVVLGGGGAAAGARNVRSISQIETRSDTDVLVDLTSDSVSGAGACADDTHSTRTLDSNASSVYPRRAQTASLTNFAQFSADPSLASTRSSTPSRTSQHSEKQ